MKPTNGPLPHPLPGGAGAVPLTTVVFTEDLRLLEHARTEVELRESQRFLRSCLDALSGHIAVLDEAGNILEVNQAWRRFADENQFTSPNYGIGFPYIQTLEEIFPQPGEPPGYVTGINDVIAGRQTYFEIEYPCHSPTEQRWFVMRVTRFQSPGPVRVVIVHDNITAKKLAEQSLRASEERYSTLFNSMDEGFSVIEVIFDEHEPEKAIDFRFLEVNPAFAKLTGMHDVVGKRVRAEINPAHEDYWFEMYGKIVNTGKSARYVNEAKQLGRWIDQYSCRIGGPGSRKVAVVFTDITERKRAEIILATQKEALEMEASGAPLKDILQLVVNAAWEHSGRDSRASLFLLEPDGLHLRYIVSTGLPEDYIRKVDNFEVGPHMPSCGSAAFTGQAVIDCDVNLEPLWAPFLSIAKEHDMRAIWSQPLRTLNGKIMGTMAIYHRTPRAPGPGEMEAIRLLGQTAALMIERHRDAEQRQQAEKSLRDSEERYRHLFDSIDEGFCVIEMLYDEHGLPVDYIFLETNPAFEKQSGLSGAVGKRVLELVPNLEKHWIEMYGQVVLTGEPIRLLSEVKSMSRWLDVYGCRVGGPGSRKVGVVFNDVTARMAAEIEIAQSRDKAIAASHAKDDFLAALSHELRTPLSPVLLLAGEAADDPAMPAEARNIFAIITKSIKLEARLIDDLLDITRITHGKMTLDPQLVDVHLVLKDAIDTVRSELEEKRLELKVNLTLEKPVMIGDPVRLQQIFWNVLRNAVKFSPVGKEITVETVILPDNIFSIKVKDSGMGITKEELARLFNSFAQGDHANADGSHRFGGLGLGLSISRRLTELHSGTIRAESAGLNQGATFFIELPLHHEADTNASGRHPEMTLPHATSDTTTFTKKSRALRHILLVEDHEATRVAMMHLLRRRHYEVVAVGSLAAARTAANETKFDILLSDVGLPDGTGHELMADLHARFGLKGIAMTGYGMDEDIARSREAGFVMHLTKPVTVQALEQALAEFGRIN